MPAVDVAKRKRAVRIANAINSIEGVPVSENAQKLYTLWANGEITGEQVKSFLYANHNKSSIKLLPTNTSRTSTLLISFILCLSGSNIEHPKQLYLC